MGKTHKKKGKSKKLSKRNDVAAGAAPSIMRDPDLNITITNPAGTTVGSLTAKSKTRLNQLPIFAESKSEGREPSSADPFADMADARDGWNRKSGFSKDKTTTITKYLAGDYLVPGNKSVGKISKRSGQKKGTLTLMALESGVNLFETDSQLKTKFINLFRLLLTRYMISCKIYELKALRVKQLQPQKPQHLFTVDTTYEELIKKINEPTEPISDEKYLTEKILSKESKDLIDKNRNYLERIKKESETNVAIDKGFYELPLIIYVDKLFRQDYINNISRRDDNHMDNNYTADRWRYIWTDPNDRRAENIYGHESYWGMHGETPGSVWKGYLDFVEEILEIIRFSLTDYKLLETFYDIQTKYKDPNLAVVAYNAHFKKLEQKMNGTIFNVGDIERNSTVGMYIFIKTALSFIFMTVKQAFINMNTDQDNIFKDYTDIIFDYKTVANTLFDKLDNITYIELLKELEIIQDGFKRGKPLSRTIKPTPVVPTDDASGTKKKRRKPKKKLKKLSKKK